MASDTSSVQNRPAHRSGRRDIPFRLTLRYRSPGPNSDWRIAGVARLQCATLASDVGGHLISSPIHLFSFPDADAAGNRTVFLIPLRRAHACTSIRTILFIYYQMSGIIVWEWCHLRIEKPSGTSFGAAVRLKPGIMNGRRLAQSHER